MIGLNRIFQMILCCVFAMAGTAFAKDMPVVAITQIVDHPAVDSVKQGILDKLRSEGFIDGKNIEIVFENAQGNTATAAQIAKSFAGLTPKVIVAISTPSAQTIKKAVEGTDIKMVFAAVTDPVSAGLVKSFDHPGANVTGVSDMPPFAEQLDLIQTLMPNKHKMGVIYNSGDAGSASSMGMLYKIAKDKGFDVKEVSISRGIDISAAVSNLVGRVDFIFVPLDNTVVSAMSTLSNVALRHGIPVFAADEGSVANGAMATVGFNYHQHGIDAGNKVVEILKAKTATDIPVSVTKKTDIVINSSRAKALGIAIPDNIAKKAKYIKI